METSKKHNKMSAMAIPKLLLNMGLPMMLSMLGQAFYNIVDTFFVSRITDSAIADMGDKAINALTLAFPIQLVIVALGVGTGVGVNALLSRNLGKGDREAAAKVAGNALILSAAYCIVMILFGIFGAKPFIETQTNDPIIADMAIRYLRIVTIVSPGALGFMMLEKIVMGTGNTIATMIGQIVGALTNIILDPIMIYGLLGVPALGIAGAAWATVIGQIVSLIVLAIIFARTNNAFTLTLSCCKPDKTTLKGIYTVGLPAIIMQLFVPLMSYVMNLILGMISVSAVTAYGLYVKLQSFIFMPAFGLNNASIPIISFNYGAKNKDRIAQTIRWGLIDITILMLIGLILFQTGAGTIVKVFSVTDESARLCVMSLRIISLGFLFVGGCILLQGVCQALGNGVYSLIISTVRMLLVPLPLAYAFAHTAHADTLVWAAFPIGELTACLTAICLTLTLYRKRVKALDSQAS